MGLNWTKHSVMSSVFGNTLFQIKTELHVAVVALKLITTIN